MKRNYNSSFNNHPKKEFNEIKNSAFYNYPKNSNNFFYPSNSEEESVFYNYPKKINYVNFDTLDDKENESSNSPLRIKKNNGIYFFIVRISLILLLFSLSLITFLPSISKETYYIAKTVVPATGEKTETIKNGEQFTTSTSGSWTVGEDILNGSYDIKVDDIEQLGTLTIVSPEGNITPKTMCSSSLEKTNPSCSSKLENIKLSKDTQIITSNVSVKLIPKTKDITISESHGETVETMEYVDGDYTCTQGDVQIDCIKLYAYDDLKEQIDAQISQNNVDNKTD